MEPLARFAVIVDPCEPFLAWARITDEEGTIDSMTDDELALTFLITDDEGTEPQELLAHYFSDIFEEMLESWVVDETLWPAERTLEMFRAWFRVRLIDMVFDLSAD